MIADGATASGADWTARVFGFKPSWKEVASVIGFALALLGLNLVTVTWFPQEAIDEVLLSDAGVNWYLGKGFVSSAWPDQGATEFCGGNLPLYPAILAGWFKLWGFSLTTWRSFSYVAGSAALLLLWLAFRRLGWLQTRWGILLFASCFFLGGPGFSALRIARYDAWQLLLGAAILLVWSWREGWSRHLLLALLGGLLLASGLQLAFCVGLCAFAALVRDWRRTWTSVAALGLGMAVAGGVVLAIWHAEGAIGGFLGNIAYTRELEREGGGFWWMALYRVVVFPVLLGHLPLLGLLYMGVAWPLARRQFWKPLLATALLVVVLQFTVHFRPYYHWLATLPLALAVAHALEQAPRLSWPRMVFCGIWLALLVLHGPVQLLSMSWASGFPRQRVELENFAATHLRATDRVISETSAYTLVKAKVAAAYFPPYLHHMPPAEAARVNAVLLQPKEVGIHNRISKISPREWLESQGEGWVFVAEVPQAEPPAVWRWLGSMLPRATASYERRMDVQRLALYRKEAPTKGSNSAVNSPAKLAPLPIAFESAD